MGRIHSEKHRLLQTQWHHVAHMPLSTSQIQNSVVISTIGIVNTLATQQNIVDSCNWVVSSAFLFGDLNRCDITTLGAKLEKCTTFHTRLDRALYLYLKLIPIPVFPWTSCSLDLNRQQLLTFFSQRGFAHDVCFDWWWPSLLTILGKKCLLSVQWQVKHLTLSSNHFMFVCFTHSINYLAFSYCSFQLTVIICQS